MKIMMDDLIARIVVTWIFLFGLLVTISAAISPGLEPNNILICQGIKPLTDNQRIPIIIAAVIFCALIQLLLQIQIWFKQCQIDKEENPDQAIPKTLESLALNIFLSILGLAGARSMYVLNSGSGGEETYTLYNRILGPTVIAVLCATRVLIKHGKDIKRELTNAHVQPVIE